MPSNNLPPGVSPGSVPGSTPEDEAAERLADDLHGILDGHDREKVVEKLVWLIQNREKAGYEQGQREQRLLNHQALGEYLKDRISYDAFVEAITGVRAGAQPLNEPEETEAPGPSA